MKNVVYIITLCFVLFLQGCDSIGDIAIEDDGVLTPVFSIQSAGVINVRQEGELDFFKVSEIKENTVDVLWLIQYDYKSGNPVAKLNKIEYGMEIDGYKSIVSAKKLEFGKQYVATAVIAVKDGNNKKVFSSLGKFMLKKK